MTEGPAKASSFEDLMAEGVKYHAAGSYQEALQARQMALELAEGLLQKGRAYRDIGQTHFRLGNVSDAEHNARNAVGAHQVAYIREGDIAEREYRASAGFLGTLTLRAAIASETRDKSTFARAAAQKARECLHTAVRLGETPGQTDQYAINFASRSAIYQGLYGNKRAGRRAAKLAWRLGKLSESPDLPYSNPNLSVHERTLASRKACRRAAAAYLVSSLAGTLDSVEFYVPKYTWRRRAALYLARKAI